MRKKASQTRRKKKAKRGAKDVVPKVPTASNDDGESPLNHQEKSARTHGEGQRGGASKDRCKRKSISRNKKKRKIVESIGRDGAKKLADRQSRKHRALAGSCYARQ